ncbi:MAG TPA: hypothetical protein VD978_25160 [Azospirillum sp.]|nr:hypothetical protein [Azospirillum sp.]
MGGLTSLATAALPVATTALSGYQQQQYRAQNTAAQASYEQQLLERKYQEERLAREEEARRKQIEQERAWQREDQLRRQEAEAAAAQRRSDMAWLAQAQNLEASQLRAQQDAEMQTAGADAQTRLASQAAQSADEERRRRDALRRAMGRARADLGGQGVSAADGSGEAILLGLVGETDQESRTAAQADLLKRQAIQQELDNARRRNLLQQAQLAQRQRIEFMSKFF